MYRVSGKAARLCKMLLVLNNADDKYTHVIESPNALATSSPGDAPVDDVLLVHIKGLSRLASTTADTTAGMMHKRLLHQVFRDNSHGSKARNA